MTIGRGKTSIEADFDAVGEVSSDVDGYLSVATGRGLFFQDSRLLR